METKVRASESEAGNWQSRAVLRTIVKGTDVDCVGCDNPIKFHPRVKALEVICNVYEDGNWKAVEHYHEQCYGAAESPYGQADTSHIQLLHIGNRALGGATRQQSE